MGCGWLGLPLGMQLITDGYTVKGSVTRADKFSLLINSGIIPHLNILNDSEPIIENPDFFDCDILIISIPPRRIASIEHVYPNQISQLIPYILKYSIRKVIFISSTSVYPDDLEIAREQDNYAPDKASGKACLAAENLLKSYIEFDTTSIRFGGLIGADRNPARFLAKSTDLIANTPVNLIHQDDCIGIISEIIKQNWWGETLNACCPEHPSKKDFYGKAARLSGLPEPAVSDKLEKSKIVDSSKLISLLDYRFKYLSPMDYLDHIESR